MSRFECLIPVWICIWVFATHHAAAEPPRGSAKSLEEQMQKIIDDATPTVVGIVISHQKYPGPKPDPKFPGRLGAYESKDPPAPRFGPFLPPPPNKLDLSKSENVADNTFGSGVIVDAAKGLVLTTQHLVDGATKIFVRLSNGEGTYADIHASDTRSDLAVLRLLKPPAGLTEAKIAAVQLVDSPDGKKANLKRGSWVIALGHPLASGFLDGAPSASWGILGNIRRRSGVAPQREELRTKPLHAYGSLLQTDARITLGSSGAVLLNLDGDAIGLASSVAAVQGSEASGGFAIPFDANYRRIIETLKQGLEVDYGFLGVAPSSAPGGGVEVSAVTPGCPAYDGGIRPGDTIKKIDGNILKDTDDLLLYVGAALAGTEVIVEFVQNGKSRKASITLAKMANPLASIASNPGPSVHGLRAEYSSLRLIGLPNMFNGPRAAPPSGVLVKDLEAGSVAEKRFKEAGEATAGWIITHVDDTVVKSPAEFYKAAIGKGSIKLTLTDPSDAGKPATIQLP